MLFVHVVELETRDGKYEKPDRAERSPVEIQNLANEWLMTPLVTNRFEPNFGTINPYGLIEPIELDDISAPPMIRLNFRSDFVKKPGKKALRKMVSDRLAAMRLDSPSSDEEPDGRDLEEIVLNDFEMNAPAQSLYGAAVILHNWRSATSDNDQTVIVVSAPDVAFAQDILSKVTEIVWRESVTTRMLYPANILEHSPDNWGYVGNYAPTLALSDLVRTAHAANAQGRDGCLGNVGHQRLLFFFNDSVKFESAGDDDELSEAISVHSLDPSLSETFTRLIENPDYVVTKAAFEFQFEKDGEKQQFFTFEIPLADKHHGGVKCKRIGDQVESGHLSYAYLGAKDLNLLFLALEVLRGADASDITDFDFKEVGEADSNEDDE